LTHEFPSVELERMDSGTFWGVEQSDVLIDYVMRDRRKQIHLRPDFEPSANLAEDIPAGSPVRRVWSSGKFVRFRKRIPGDPSSNDVEVVFDAELEDVVQRLMDFSNRAAKLV
jgi:hypothetical protein